MKEHQTDVVWSYVISMPRFHLLQQNNKCNNNDPQTRDTIHSFSGTHRKNLESIGKRSKTSLTSTKTDMSSTQ
jgi:hypothetical protein